MSRISVIIPAYNRSSLIGETLRSLLAQTLPADEIIVVDDGSTDNTAEVAESFGPPVTVIRRANGGPAAARNTGFQASRGKFIHFFDSDDLAAPNKHETQFKALERTGADVAIGPWIQGWFDGKTFKASNHVLQQRGLPRGDLPNALLSHWSFVPHTSLFRRQIVQAAGGFDESLFLAEDQLMFLRCLLAGARVTHTPETIEFYRLGNSSKITENEQWALRRLREWARFLLKARDACLRAGIEPLRWFGYRRRLWEAQQDLRRAKCSDVMLSRDLTALVSGKSLSFFCHWHRQTERWRGGLQQRFTGARAHTSFAAGPIDSNQLAMLEALGYGYQSPRHPPWWLCKRRILEPCAG